MMVVMVNCGRWWILRRIFGHSTHIQQRAARVCLRFVDLAGSAVRLIVEKVLRRCCLYNIRGHTGRCSVVVIICKIYNCFAVLIYLMVLIATENVGAVDQICWIVYIINNVSIDVVNIVGYIAVATARANTVCSSDSDAASIWNWFFPNVAPRVASTRANPARWQVGINEECIVGRKEDVIIAIIDVNLSRWQSGRR